MGIIALTWHFGLRYHVLNFKLFLCWKKQWDLGKVLAQTQTVKPLWLWYIIKLKEKQTVSFVVIITAFILSFWETGFHCTYLDGRSLLCRTGWSWTLDFRESPALAFPIAEIIGIYFFVCVCMLMIKLRGFALYPWVILQSLKRYLYKGLPGKLGQVSLVLKVETFFRLKTLHFVCGFVVGFLQFRMHVCIMIYKCACCLSVV